MTLFGLWRTSYSFLIGALLPFIAIANELPGYKLDYREALECGPNALFMFLILAGHNEVQFRQLQSLPLSPDGVSLLTLCQAAKLYGVRAQVRHYRTNEIGSIPLPAVIALETSRTSLTPFHFDVLYKVQENRLFLLNGTTGEPFEIPIHKMPIFWKGYAMIAPQSSGIRTCVLGLCVVLLIADTAVVFRYFSQ